MKRIKRIAFFITAMCMLFCLVLSSTDWVIKEEVADVKKISVCVALEERPGLESLKRGILETAGDSDILNAHITLGEQAFGFQDSGLDNIVGQGKAGFPLKKVGEIVRIQIDHGSQRVPVQFFAEMISYIRLHGTDGIVL